MSDIVKHLEKLLSVPAGYTDSSDPPTVSYEPVHDAVTLTCGCIVSRRLFSLSTGKEERQLGACPLCNTANVHILAACKNMQNLYLYWTKLKLETASNHHSKEAKEWPESERAAVLEEEDETDLPSMFSRTSTDRQKNQHPHPQQLYPDPGTGRSPGAPSSQSNLSFLTAFHEALMEAQNSSSVDSYEKASTFLRNSPQEPYSDHPAGHASMNPSANSPTNVSVISSLGSIQRQRTKQSFQSSSSNLTKLMTSQSTTSNRNSANKELLLSKNFPFFRRIYSFNIYSSNFILKTKLFIQTQLSPKITKLVLLTEKKWEVYTLDTEKPEKQPKLLCCGKSDGSFGSDFDCLKKMKKDQIISNSNIVSNPAECISLLENWEHLYCQITENLLVISGTRGFMRILDLTQNGRCVFTYRCNFPIRCLDVSPNEEYIALGITGKDKYTQVEQAVIILIKLIPETSKSAFHISTYPFSLPYRDPICTIKFSPDSTLLSVATVLESRFLVISLDDPSRPALIMKSQRRLDTSLDSEGITDMAFFPDNRIMTICSSSHNSEPIIIDTNIASISGPDGIAKPKLLMRIDEVGSTIHKCCVSPRGDSVAYINRNGNVYIITAPSMDDNDNKRVSCVLEVSNAARAKEAASIKFDADGYKLYVLDRKGVLSIADFTAGTVEDHSVSRCKIVT